MEDIVRSKLSCQGPESKTSPSIFVQINLL